MLYMPWKAASQQWLPAAKIDPEVRAARELLHANLKKRFLDDLPEEQRTELDISTLLDPRFKTYSFLSGIGNLGIGDPADEKETAMSALSAAWAADWKLAPVAPDAAPAPARAPAPAPAPAPAAAITTASATAAGKKGASSSFFAIPLAPQPATTAAAKPAAEVRDDLDKYLALPSETNMDLDVLAWWKAKDCPEELPLLAKMARQYLGRPASSAGVERMFSKAGKLYDDAKKRQDDETLEAALFAAANTE